jgi:hypothetical protein
LIRGGAAATAWIEQSEACKMPQVTQLPVLAPLAVGAAIILCTVFIHALAVGATVNFIRYERHKGRMGTGFLIDLAIVVSVVLFAFSAHLLEIALWAGLLLICGEFGDFGVAFYHSAVNYTTLGYGDIILTPSWRLLGPLEAANGALLFGVSTAIVFAVMQRLIQARYQDLRD